MTSIDIFYQGEGLRDIAHFEARPDLTFAGLKRAIVDKHNLPPETLIFLEDGEDPVDEAQLVTHHVGRAGVKVHVHRCRHIAVAVTFNGETVRQPFAPAITVAHVKKWAAEKKFDMTPAEAGEHVLQISGTTDRPDLGTHLGTIVAHPNCSIAFDLVPNERVNGFAPAHGARA